MATTTTTSIHKVRRRALGGKRAMGRDMQRRGKRIRRRDATRIQVGDGDCTLTSVGGLVGFSAFARRLGLPDAMRAMFGHLKTGRGVVYPMGSQVEMLIDANVVGEERVFGLEALAADPLFVHLCGGSVSSIDTAYRDLCRFEDMDIAKLELHLAMHGVTETKRCRLDDAHLDIDTSVLPLFGNQEGASLGYNPRYHGRPSYNSFVAVMAETRCVVGAELRPGDTGFGGEDARRVRICVDRARAAVGPRCRLMTRIDAAGDCAEILGGIVDGGSFFLVKARFTQDLVGVVAARTVWRTFQHDADGRAERQVAEIKFEREQWRERGLRVRVIAVRSRDRDVGKQVHLWEDLDYTVQVFLTNDFDRDPEDLAAEYDARAEIEPVLAELKGALGIGKVPSQCFNANHAAFLLKMLAHNLVRRYVRFAFRRAMSWRMPWIRRALFAVPGRLVRSGRRWKIHLPPTSAARSALLVE